MKSVRQTGRKQPSDRTGGRKINDKARVRRAEKALRESEERLRLIAETIDEVFWMTDAARTKLYYVSPAYERVWGRTVASLYQNPRDFFNAIDPEDQARVQAALLRLDGHPFDLEYRVIQPDGTVRWVQDRGFPLGSPKKPASKYVGVVRDITERKELELEILRASELERQHLATDVHDGLAQQVTGIACLTNLLEKNLAGQSSPSTALVERIAELVGDAMRQVKHLAREAHPVAKEPTGLMMALDNLAIHVAGQFGIACHFHCERLVPVTNTDMATQLYWIAQEEVYRAVKQLHASQIELVLSSTPAQITLIVESDGLATKNPEGQQNAMEFRITKYRANTIGGVVSLRDTADGGSELVCTCPVRTQSKSDGGSTA